MKNPQRWRTCGGNPLIDGGGRGRLLRPQSSRYGSSSLFEEGKRREKEEKKGEKWAGAVALAHTGSNKKTYVIVTKKGEGGGSVGRPVASMFPHREPEWKKGEKEEEGTFLAVFLISPHLRRARGLLGRKKGKLRILDYWPSCVGKGRN